jgi:hypothetical protein
MNHLTSEGNLDFDGFTDIIFRLLKAAWGDKWGTFVEAFPNGTDPTNITMPIVTYSLVDMRPAVMGNGSVREIKPRLRDQFSTTDDNGGPGPYISIYGQTMDCLVEFQCWEENHVKATKLAKDFRDFMRTYTGYLLKKGVQQIIFEYQSNEVTASFRDDAICKKQVYRIRFEDQYVVPSDVIEKVTASVEAKQGLDDDSINQSRIDFKLP